MPAFPPGLDPACELETGQQQGQRVKGHQDHSRNPALRPSGENNVSRRQSSPHHLQHTVAAAERSQLVKPTEAVGDPPGRHRGSHHPQQAPPEIAGKGPVPDQSCDATHCQGIEKIGTQHIPYPAVNSVISDSSSQIARVRQLDSPYFSPESVRIEFYQGVEPIFEHFAVEPALEEALGARVELPSGGTLFIEVGEALTAIDVNSGRSQRGGSPEQTALITNLEAAGEALRQLRLRDIAGLVVIDFVNLRERENRRRLMVTIREAASDDPNMTRVLDISDLGLVELVRRRARRPLSETMLEDCPHCGGSGQRKSAESVALEIVRDVLRHARSTPSGRISILASSSVTEVMNNLAATSALTEALARPVDIHVQEDFEHDEFEIAINNVP